MKKRAHDYKAMPTCTYLALAQTRIANNQHMRVSSHRHPVFVSYITLTATKQGKA